MKTHIDNTIEEILEIYYTHSVTKAGSGKEVVRRLSELVEVQSKRYADERVRRLLEDNFHFWRECPSCGYASNDYLHCLHDRIQSKCTKCDEILPSFDGYCECEFCITEKDVEIYLNQNTESEEGEVK